MKSNETQWPIRSESEWDYVPDEAPTVITTLQHKAGNPKTEAILAEIRRFRAEYEAQPELPMPKPPKPTKMERFSKFMLSPLGVLLSPVVAPFFFFFCVTYSLFKKETVFGS